jgi:hypothetical protein
LFEAGDAMKKRRQFLSMGIGTVLVLGSLVAFPSPAQAAPGDVTMTGTMDIPLPTSASFSGTGSFPTATSWAGSVAGVGTSLGVIDVSMAFDDEITWTDNPSGPDPAVQTMSNVQIVIDTTAAPSPPQAVCVVDFLDPQVLTASDFPVSSSYRTGTFTSVSAPIGDFVLSEGTSCAASGLADLIRFAFGDSGSGTGSGYATTELNAVLDKSLELPTPPTKELVIDGTYDVLGTTTVTDCEDNFGVITGSTWTGTIDCDGVNGTPGCFDQNISANDTLNWGVSPVTETLSSIVITVTANSACSGGAPVTCIVTLGGSRVLQAAFFPLFLGHRTGSFVESSGMTVGAYTLTDGGNCVASGYSALFATYLGTSPSTRPFDVAWAKDLTV